MGDSSLPGRRRLRHDKEALIAATSGYRVVLLGPMYLKINNDMIAEFQSRGNVPVSQNVRKGIIARHSKSDAGTITCQMRDKGVWEATGPGTTRTVDVVPRFKDTIFADSRSKVIAYPLNLAGRKLDEIGHEPSGALSPEPAVEPSSPETSKVLPVFKSKAELEAELAGLEQQISDAQERDLEALTAHQQECTQVDQEIAKLKLQLAELLDKKMSIANNPPVSMYDQLHGRLGPYKESLKQLIDTYDATVALLLRN